MQKLSMEGSVLVQKKKKEKSQHSIDLGRTNKAPFAFFFSMSAVIARFQNNGIHTHQNESYLS